jgi:hypothetical protein
MSMEVDNIKTVLKTTRPPWIFLTQDKTAIRNKFVEKQEQIYLYPFYPMNHVRPTLNLSLPLWIKNGSCNFCILILLIFASIYKWFFIKLANYFDAYISSATCNFPEALSWVQQIKMVMIFRSYTKLIGYRWQHDLTPYLISTKWLW